MDNSKIKFNMYFSKKNQSRGYDYFLRDTILYVKEDNNKVRAIVSGSEDYEVSIDFNSDPLKLSCTCPYAKAQHCKHMAAVMYYLRDTYLNDKKEDVGLTNYEKDESINKLDCYSKELVQRIKIDIQSDIKSICGRKGYIDWDEGFEFVDMFKEYYHLVNSLINDKEEVAFEIIKYLYQTLEKVEMDGSNGEHSVCLEMLIELSNKYLNKNKRNIIHYIKFVRKYSNSNHCTFIDSQFTLLENNAKNPEYACKVLKLFDEIIQNNKSTNMRYYTDNLHVAKVTLLYCCDGEDEALNYAYEHSECLGMKEKLASIYKQTNSEEYIKILKDLIFDDNSYLTSQYINEIAQYYRDNNNQQELIEMLEKLFIKRKEYSIYLMLKLEVSKDIWREYLIKLIQKSKLTLSMTLLNIFKNEEWTNELFNGIEKSKSITYLCTFVDSLKTVDSDKICNLFYELILEESKNAKNRNQYRSVINDMKKLASLNKSDIYLKKLIEELRKQYANKPAFLEELTYFERRNF